jgi:hypothetical protein
MNLYEDVRRCCLTRPTIQRHINEPAFWEVAIGCLVRVRVEDGQQITYQVINPPLENGIHWNSLK